MREMNFEIRKKAYTFYLQCGHNKNFEELIHKVFTKEEKKEAYEHLLYFSCLENNITAAQILIYKEKVDVNIKDEMDRTLLMLSKTYDMDKLLVDKGANVNAVDMKNQSALMYFKSAKSVELFIKKGADVNVKTLNGQTPLFFACSYESVETMINGGANIFEVDDLGNSFLAYVNANKKVSDKDKEKIHELVIMITEENDKGFTA